MNRGNSRGFPLAHDQKEATLLLKQRRTLPEKHRTTIEVDLETREWIRVYAKKYKMTMPEALYEIVNRIIATEEDLAPGPKLGT
jgi:hypothetical protein